MDRTFNHLMLTMDRSFCRLTLPRTWALDSVYAINLRICRFFFILCVCNFPGVVGVLDFLRIRNSVSFYAHFKIYSDARTALKVKKRTREICRKLHSVELWLATAAWLQRITFREVRYCVSKSDSERLGAFVSYIMCLLPRILWVSWMLWLGGIPSLQWGKNNLFYKLFLREWTRNGTEGGQSNCTPAMCGDCWLVPPNLSRRISRKRTGNVNCTNFPDPDPQ